jgi:hypothetical protein
MGYTVSLGVSFGMTPWRHGWRSNCKLPWLEIRTVVVGSKLGVEPEAEAD